MRDGYVLPYDVPRLAEALWSTLEAVRRKQVTFVDEDVFYLNTGPTAAQRVLAVFGHTAGP